MDGGNARTAGLAAEANELDFAANPDLTQAVGTDESGRAVLHLMVEGVHCGGCVAKIERTLAAQPEIVEGRVNLTTRRLVVRWNGPADAAARLLAPVRKLGFGLTPFDPTRLDDSEAREEKFLLRCLGVAGFAAANVMLLSVSVWAGHAQGMEEATRTLLHWFSALIVLPALAYAGRPFFRSAITALAGRRTNMDVPISLAVILAAGVSLAETIRGGPHAYFDSAITLLFFLLIGRFLDRRARGRARSAAHRLLALAARSVTRIDPDGSTHSVAPDRVRLGDTVLAAMGERVAVDGIVIDGRSEIDTALITGETIPTTAGPGDRVFAGTVNRAAPLTLRVTAVGQDTLLGEIVRLMEAAEQRKSRYVALADRLARLYAPVVHALAAATFLGWWLGAGMAWQDALMIAVSVLIITCPCALGLAVPAVQVIASGRLMRRGTLLKSATALERLATVDTVVFDKTGTLTLGRPELAWTTAGPDTLRAAASMAATSRHPLAQALARACPDRPAPPAGVEETPGSGLSRTTPDGELRLGSRVWCGVAEADLAPAPDEAPAPDGPELWYRAPGTVPTRFVFQDPPRADAATVITDLTRAGMDVELLSGDREVVVRPMAAALGIKTWAAAQTPVDKVARLQTLGAEGRQVLMVGDGLNDAPALAAATVSMSPSTAIDISQTAADAVFQGGRLAPVVETLSVSRRAAGLVRQNFGLALGYNVITIPLAVAGFVTPLIAAIAMSASSIVVVSNALRLSGGRRKTS